MHDFLPFIFIGLATGAVYGLAGVGLVLTYKTSGIFNFGYGAIAALSAFLFYFLHVDHHLAWPLTALICVVVFAPLLGLLLELMARSLQGAPEVFKVVATVGLILTVQSLGVLWHPDLAPTFPPFLPQDTVPLFGVNVTWEQIILFAFSVVASAGLYWFFRATRFGLVMRGVVDNAELVSMSGDDPVQVRRWAWILGTVFSSVAGVLLASTQSLDGITLTTIVFAAFGAAAIGQVSSLPLTFVGGLIIGVAAALTSKYAATVEWVGGLPPSLPFIVLFVVLVVTPRRRLAGNRLPAPAHVQDYYHAPARLRLLAGAIAIALLALVPTVQATHVAAWSAGLISVVLFLSLGLLVRQSGLISLCQFSFAAVGAAAFGHFATDFGMPWLLAVVLATLTAVPVGALIAIPAVRVSGVFLALATLGFAILAEQVFFKRDFMFGNSTLGIPEPRPAVSIGGWDLASDNGFYYLLLVIVVLVVAFVMLISSGRLGRLLEALGHSPLALETNGASANVLKVIVFSTAAALASLSGALTGMLYQFGIGSYFTWFNSVYVVAVVVIMAVGGPWFALLGGIAYAVLPGYIHGATVNTWLQLIFGVSASLAVYGVRAAGAPQPVRRFLDRLGGRKPVEATAIAGEHIAVPGPSAPMRRPEPQAARQPSSREGLVVSDLTVRFGGVTAVNGVNLRAPLGVITGLLGPNGAGKTTTFNACSGLVRPTSGKVLLHGADLTHTSSAHRARSGLGRTFQRTELFNGLTVRQNVAMGREAGMAGGNPLTQMLGSRQASRAVAAATEEALHLTGTTHLANTEVRRLTIGQRRLVELARTLAGRFDLLLLDEPSSGLDDSETEAFGSILKTVVQQRACGILLVEHDMTLVRDVCDHIYVLDFGTLIFEGSSAQMLESDVVRSAYLGDTNTPVEDEQAAADESAAAAIGERR